MHPMRRLIALNEAPKKILTPEEYARIEQERQAQQLAQAKVAVGQLKAKAMETAKISQRSDYYGTWEQGWVDEMRATIKTIYQRVKAANQKEHEYQLEDNPSAQPGVVNMAECIVEGTAAWWDQKKDMVDWSDARYRWEEYMDAHPRTEQSDDMSRLQSEDEMLKHIYHLGGGFGSIAEMDKTLTMIASHIDDMQRYSDGGWSQVGTTSTDIIKKGIPVIVSYCKLIENIQ